MTTGSRTMNGRYTVMGLTGGSSGQTAAMTVGRYYSRTWSGANATPGSVKKVRKGPKSPRANHLVLQPNPYRVDWQETENGLITVRDKPELGMNAGANDTSLGDSAWAQFPTVDPRQIYKLIAKLESRVYGQNWHPAAALAEGFKAIDMIYNAAVRIGASIEAVKRKDWRSLKRALPWLHPVTMQGVAKTGKSTSQRVLEIQYGWRPLMSDAHDAGTWLAAALDQTNRSRDRYSASRSWDVYSKKPPWSISGAQAMYASEVTHFRARYTVLTNSIQAVYVPTMWSFAEALWERTPWSFIGDWFVPIQGYLNSMNALTGISGTFVLQIRAERISEGHLVNPLRCTGSGLPKIGVNRLSVGYFERSVSTKPIVPKPVDVKGIGEALSRERTVNAIALLGGRAWPALLSEMYRHPPTSGRLRA